MEPQKAIQNLDVWEDRTMFYGKDYLNHPIATTIPYTSKLPTEKDNLHALFRKCPFEFSGILHVSH